MNGINQTADMNSGRNSPGLDLPLRICRVPTSFKFEENRPDRSALTSSQSRESRANWCLQVTMFRSTQPDFRRALTL